MCVHGGAASQILSGVRCFAFFVLFACGGPGGTAPAPHPTNPLPVVRSQAVADRVPIDPIAVLAPVDGGRVSWLVPGRIQLELGAGTAIEAPGGNRPIEVAIVERQGTLVRAVVRLPHARFSLWTDESRLLGVIQRESRMAAPPGGNPMSPMFVALRAGARVRRLAHRGQQTQVRFVGALEVEGWVSDDAIAESAEARDPVGRIASGRRTLMVSPGAVIRSEPKWGMNELATMANGYFLDTIAEVDAAWVEIAYADGEVTLHGYVSRQAPPGRVHRTKDAEVAPQTIVANAKVASGTCLYTRRNGEAIGYVVGDREVQLEDVGSGWWTLAIDTPWGPIPFATRGASESSLVACAPAGSVAPPAGTPAISPTP